MSFPIYTVAAAVPFAVDKARLGPATPLTRDILTAMFGVLMYVI